MLYEDCELKSVLDGILQAVPDVSSPPPVPRILLPVSDTTPARKKAKADRDITAVYAEMVQNYRKDLPAANVTDDRLCPPTRKIPLSELPQQLDRCHEKFKVVENSNLLNGAIFFSKHRVNIRRHFREDKTLGAKWSHALSCKCGQCGP